MRAVQIEVLADRPEFIHTLAEWHFREWAYLRPGDSVANRITMLRERSGRRELPITFVASSGTELLGSAMLIDHDMDSRPDYSPWLAGVFVAPAQRRHGIGRALTEHVVHKAAALGYADPLSLHAERSGVLFAAWLEYCGAHSLSRYRCHGDVAHPSCLARQLALRCLPHFNLQQSSPLPAVADLFSLE